MTEPVRWGVLSTARIATEKVIPGMRKSPLVDVAAIASRDPGSAEAAAARLGIPVAHGSYEALLADPRIEAVYNPLPNHLHVPMTLAAARAGKHVLCEKPMALTAAELDALRPYAARVHLREAFMVRHHPQWAEARERVRSGAIGEPRYLHVAFSYYNDDPANIRNQPGIGGGALYDIGCYAVVAGRWFYGGEPGRAAMIADHDPAFGTDRTTSGLLDFGAGRQLAFTVSTQALRHQRLQIVGTRGRIELEIPFNAPQDGPVRWWIDTGAGPQPQTVEEADQYRLQAEAFSRAVRDDAPNFAGLDEAAATLRVVEALLASEKSGRVEPV